MCVPESDASFCSRLGATCGALTANDNCGTQRSVTSCGMCASGFTCGATNANTCGVVCARAATRPCSAECFCEESKIDDDSMLDVWAFSTTNAWAVGTRGSILHFDGTLWTKTPPVTTATLWSMWAWSTTDIWAVGSGGTILHFDGANWSPVASGTTQTLYAITGAGPTSMWAVGANGIGTKWNGATWTAQTIRAKGDCNGISTLGSGYMVVGYDPTTQSPFATRLNGTTWSDTTLPSGTDALYDVRPNGLGGLVAVGLSGTIVTWAGASWTKQPYPLNNGNGIGQSLLRVSRGTSSWLLPLLHADSFAPTGYVRAPATGRAAYDLGTQTILVGEGSAATWTSSSATTTVLSPGTGLAYKSAWGGGPNDVWLAGGSTVAGALWHWDGTRVQQQFIASPVAVKTLYDTWGSAPNDVYAVGDGLGIFHFDGTSWSTIENQSNMAFAGAYFAVHGSSANDVWVTAMGKVRHFNGTTWADEVPPVTSFELLSDVWAASPTNVWAVGSNGKVVHRTAAGWALVPSGSTNALTSVWGSSANDVWVGGDNGYVARWNGTSFVAVTTGLTGSVKNIAGRGPNDVWLISDSVVRQWDGARFRTVNVDGQAAYDQAWLSPTTLDAWVVGEGGLARRRVP